MTLNVRMRDDMIQCHFLAPQVDRQNKGWVQDIPVGICLFFLKDTLRKAINMWKEMLPTKTFSEMTFIL